MSDKKQAQQYFNSLVTRGKYAGDETYYEFIKLPAIDVLRSLIEVCEPSAPEDLKPILLGQYLRMHLDLLQRNLEMPLTIEPTDFLVAIQQTIDIHAKHNVTDVKSLPKTIATLKTLEEMHYLTADLAGKLPGNSQLARAAFLNNFSTIMQFQRMGREVPEELLSEHNSGPFTLASSDSPDLQSEDGQRLANLLMLTPVNWSDEDLAEANSVSAHLPPKIVSHLYNSMGANDAAIAQALKFCNAGLVAYQNLGQSRKK